MISCARVYWIFHFISRSFHPRLCFIAFKMKFNYPVPSHFQFSGRVLEKKFGTGRVPGSRRTLLMITRAPALLKIALDHFLLLIATLYQAKEIDNEGYEEV